MNFAIVGCGMIGMSTAKCFSLLEEERLAAVFDRRLDRARSAAERFGVERVYTDYDALLADPEVDAVIVCTASHVHAEQTVKALRAGKAAACEKPLDSDLSAAEETARVSRETGIPVQCLYQRRCIPQIRAAREVIRSGVLGKICFAEARNKYYRGQSYYDEAPWRGVSGGVLLNQGIHGIDMLLWMLGEPVREVMAAKGTVGHETCSEDTAAALLTLEGGGIAAITATTCAYGEDITEFAIHGTRGTLNVDVAGALRLNMPGEAESGASLKDFCQADGENFFGLMDKPFNGNFHAWLLHDLNMAIKEKRRLFIPPEEVLDSLRVTLAMHESAEKGRRILLN